tara:strand:- start:1369 stop:2001 length:633 start_codon:yes stop_codon:yes gene_type:complete
MKKINNYQTELRLASKLLNEGQIIAIPTDTYYGLACDPFNFESLNKLFKLKERDIRKPLPLLIASKEDLLNFGIDYSDFENLLDAFWPGPITIVMKTEHKFYNGMIENDGYVGFRVPNLEFVRDLIKFSGIPITGTSANISGQPETKDINVLEDSLDLNIVKMIVNINCGKEQSASTVIKLSDGRVEMLRKGPIKSNQIKEILGNDYKYE